MADKAAQQDEKILAEFKREFDEAEKFHKRLCDQWDEFYAAYIGKPKLKVARKKSWRSRLYAKYLFQQVQMLLVEVTQFDTELDFLPKTPNDAVSKEINEKLILSQLYIDGWDDKRVDALINAMIYGGQPVKVVQDIDKFQRKMPAPQGKPGEYVLVPYVKKNQPSAQLVDPERCYHDPTATQFRNCRYVFEELFKTPEELKALADVVDEKGVPVYKNLDKLDRVLEANRNSKGSALKKLIGKSEEQKPGGVRVLQRWKRNRLTIVVNDELIIRDEMNTYWHGEIPFVMIRTQRDTKNMYGFSETWSGKDIQEALWTLQNAMYDALRITVTPPLALDDNDPQLKTVEFKPGARYYTRDPQNAVVPIRLSGVEHYVNEQAVGSLVALMERMTGANSALSGVSNVGSATEAAGNLEQSKGRVGLKNKTVDKGVARIVEFFRELNRQFLTPTDAYRLIGPEGAQFVQITQQNLAADFDIRPKGSSDRATKSLRRQAAQDLFNTVLPTAGQPLPDGRLINVEPAMRKLLEANDVDNIDAFFVAPPAPPMPMGGPEGAPAGAPAPEGEPPMPPLPGVPGAA